MSEPDWIAQLDQATSRVADLAKLLWAYHKALSGAGFPPDAALALTMQFQAGIIAARPAEAS